MFGFFKIFRPKIEQRYYRGEIKECLYSSYVQIEPHRSFSDYLISYYLESYDKEFIDKLKPYIPKNCGGTSLDLDYSIPEDLAIIKAQSFHKLIGSTPDDKYVNKHSFVNPSWGALSMFVDNLEYDYFYAPNGIAHYLDPLEPSKFSYFNFVIRCDNNWKLCDGSPDEVARHIKEKHYEKYNSSIHKPININDINLKNRTKWNAIYNNYSKVDYIGKVCNSLETYPYYIFPQIGTELTSITFGNEKIYPEGVEENFLFSELSNLLIYKDYQLFKRISVPNIDGKKPFCPDIAILGKNGKKSIRIDIEIDEPYGYKTKEPAHYIENNFDKNKCRDEFMCRNGWIVIRFSELQVAQDVKACAMYVMNLLKNLDSEIIGDFECNISVEKRWSLQQALEYAQTDWRKKYLNQ